jgi:hypothetical protein
MQYHPAMRDPVSQMAYERMLDHMAKRHQAAMRSYVFRKVARDLPKALLQNPSFATGGYLSAE